MVATQLMIVIFENDVTDYVVLNSTVVSLYISLYCN